jgi:hypothetical protein
MTHEEFSRRGGESKSRAKVEAARMNAVIAQAARRLKAAARRKLAEKAVNK